MNLVHITAAECPTCGSFIVAESRSSRRHCNGQAWETREFACGCRIAWIPNYSESEIAHPCPKDPATELKNKKREEAKAKVLDLIESLDVDKAYKENLIIGIKYV